MRILTMQEYRLWQQNPNGLSKLADDSSIDLNKGRPIGGKYLRREATGNPKAPWRYIYAEKAAPKAKTAEERLRELPVLDVDDFMVTHGTEWLEQDRSSEAAAKVLSETEKGVIQEWSYDGSIVLRAVSITDEEDEQDAVIARDVRIFRRAIAKAEQMPRKPVTLFRGIAVNNDSLAKILDGEVMQDAGLSSWTTAPETASEFANKNDKYHDWTHVVFKVKTTKGLAINKIPGVLSPQERETVLDSSAFRIAGKRVLASTMAGGEMLRHNVVLLELEEMQA